MRGYNLGIIKAKCFCLLVKKQQGRKDNTSIFYSLAVALHMQRTGVNRVPYNVYYLAVLKTLVSTQPLPQSSFSCSVQISG